MGNLKKWDWRCCVAESRLRSTVAETCAVPIVGKRQPQSVESQKGASKQWITAKS